MPWQETCPVDERLRFVREYQRLELSMAELCRTFGVSRRTGYKWVKRFEERGRAGLEDQGRAPHNHPNTTPGELEEVVVELRRQHPTWGPRKLRAWCEKHIPNRKWPATSTVGDIIRRHGLVTLRRRAQRVAPYASPLAHADRPNAVWCADFKGWFRTGDGARCDPLTITDAFSRYVICNEVLDGPTREHVQPTMERAFREFGLPFAMRTDNGPPFASNAVAGLSRLSVWLVRLGVTPERIEPGKPQQNGRHERFHRTLKAETAKPPKADRQAQQRAFDRFRREYNEERPHEALSMKTPASVYHASPRPFPNHLPELEYPVAYEVRRVRPNGEIKWAGDLMYVGQVLAGELVGLEPLDGRHWRVRFGTANLGTVDGWKREWTSKDVGQTNEVLPMSPV